MRRFVICILGILGVARCSASDIIFPKPSEHLGEYRPPPIKESLKNFQVHLQRYSNDIIKKLTALEATITETNAISSQTFEYQVQTEVFKHPILNKFLKSAEKKMSDLAQIFEDDFILVTNNAKDIINERFDERITALQESIDSVRSNVEELASRNSISELKYNVISNIALQINQREGTDILLPSKASLGNMTDTFNDRIQVIRDKSNNVSECTNKTQQIEDSLTKVMEYERKFAQAKYDLMNTTIPKCPAMPSNLESALKMNTDTIENISDILKDTEIKVLKFLDASFRSVDFPTVQ